VHVYGKDLLRGTIERPYAAQLPGYLTDSTGGPTEPVQAVLSGDVDAILAKHMPEDLSRSKKLARLQNDLATFKIETSSEADPQDPAASIKAMLDAKFESIKFWEMAGLFLTTLGGGIGLVAFGPICERIGRRSTFLFYHLGALVVALILFLGIPTSSSQLLYGLTLPVFGFLTLGMHAGYAIYFPELFPTRLRATGGGFCFNVARALAAPILFLSGWMQQWWHFSLGESVSMLSSLYLIGVVVILLAPETKGQKLPE
jgi:MFS family permease